MRTMGLHRSHPAAHWSNPMNASPNKGGRPRKVIKPFQPLEQVTSPTVDTDAAAYYLNRRPQTLRG